MKQFGKKICVWGLLLAFALMLLGCSEKDGNEEGATPTSVISVTGTEEANETENNETNENGDSTVVEPGFTVDGTKLLDANGEEFMFRGINHPHAWFTREDATAMKAIAETGSNTVRIVCGSGQQFTKDDAARLDKVIQLAISNHMIAIVEVHDVTGNNSIDDLVETADYWISVKDVLNKYTDTVILNIANEWGGTWDSELWRDGYTKVIPMLRDAGICNTILVDAGGWGQYAKSIADYGKEVFAADKLANTMFAIHMYGSAGGNASTIKNNIDSVVEQGLCVCIGEFGYKHSDGEVDEAYIMKYCVEQGIGYLGWSWKGNGGGVEYLDLALEWDGSVLSGDWGEVLINGENGIRSTSAICSVFEAE